MNFRNTPTGRIAGWALVAAYALALFLLSVGSPGSMTVRVVQSLPGGNIGAHILIYAVLALLLCAALYDKERLNRIGRIISAFVLAALYGALLELAQLLVSLRNAAVADVAYNAVGAVVGCALWMAVESVSARFSSLRAEKREKGAGERLVRKAHNRLADGAEVWP